MADYVKMWKDLGMDLESHDLLCQVLPTAVGDVFLTQENRPKAMDFWDLVISEVHGIRPAELIEQQKLGRKVFGTFCVFVPDEVIIAANGIVTGLCGGSQFWVPGGEAVLPKNTCPLIKASVGARLGRGGLHRPEGQGPGREAAPGRRAPVPDRRTVRISLCAGAAGKGPRPRGAHRSPGTLCRGTGGGVDCEC